MLKFLGQLLFGLLLVSITGGFLWLKTERDNRQAQVMPYSITKDLTPVPNNYNQAVNLNIRIHNRQMDYRIGEHMSFTVTASKSGYITLWDIGTSNTVRRIFPNQFSADSMYVKAGQKASIGGESTRFDFRVAGKSGLEDVYAIWTAKAEDQPDQEGFESTFSFAKELIPFGKSNRKSWASDKISFEIVADDKDDALEPRKTGKQFMVAGKVYIVAMGANVKDLTKTNLDARYFAEQLKSMFPSNKVDMNIIEDVTKKQFLGALKDLASKVREEDTVFIYFSGHGLLQADTNNHDEAFDAYFVTNNMGKTDREGNFTLTEAVSDDEFAYHVNQIPTENIISVIDACHSGAMQKGMLKAQVKYFNGKLKGAFVAPESFIIPQSDEIIPVIDNVKGLVFAAAEESDYALEVLNGGVFTQTFLQEIRNAKVDDTLMDIFTNTRQIVKRDTKRFQIPVYKGDIKIAERLGVVSSGGVYSQFPSLRGAL